MKQETVIKTCKKHGDTEYYLDSEDHWRCRQCRRETSKAYDAKNKDKKHARDKQNRTDSRQAVLKYYSGGNNPFCACCGETHYEFLSLDHINGDGNKHRKEVGAEGARMYSWAIKNGFPPIFRVLCHNCNQSLGLYGYCPHQREEK